MKSSPRSKRIWLSLAALLLLGLLGTGYYFKKTIGLRNALSPAYWTNRAHGFEYYNPQKLYFSRGSRDKKDVVLTIDDAPHRVSMDLILRTLKEEHVPATFFVIGKRVKESPDITKRILDEGHEIGNHTQDHIRLDTLNEKQVRAEILNCQTNVIRATGHSMKFLRPPGMRFTPTVLKVVKELGYITVGWNIGAKDFIPTTKEGHYTLDQIKALQVTPEVIAQRVVKQLQNGTIILLHDNPLTAKALKSMIEQVKAQGYTFRSTTEMLARLPKPIVVDANPVAKR